MRLEDAILTSSNYEAYSRTAGGLVVGNRDLDRTRFFFVPDTSLRQKTQMYRSVIDYIEANLPGVEDWEPLGPLSPLECLAREAERGQA